MIILFLFSREIIPIGLGIVLTLFDAFQFVQEGPHVVQ